MTTREFASKIVREIVIIKSYSLWRDAKFRTTVNFAGLTPKKQDIIFNELQASSLAYLLFFLEDKTKKAKNRERVIYANISEYVIDGFLSIMADTKMNSKTLLAWSSLLENRVETYRSDMGSLIKESSVWEVFKGQDKFLRETWGRIVTLSFDTAKQISGETNISLEDPLWRELRKYLISLEVDLVEAFKDEDLSDIRVLN